MHIEHLSTSQQATRLISYFSAMKRPSQYTSTSPRPVTLPGQIITSTSLRRGSASTRPMNRPVSTYRISRNVNMRFITIKCMAPLKTKAKWYYSISPQLPKASVLNFILFGAVHTKLRKSSAK